MHCSNLANRSQSLQYLTTSDLHIARKSWGRNLGCPTVLVDGGTPFNLEGEGDHIFGEGSHSLTALLTLPPPSFTPTFSITSNSQFGLVESVCWIEWPTAADGMSVSPIQAQRSWACNKKRNQFLSQTLNYVAEDEWPLCVRWCGQLSLISERGSANVKGVKFDPTSSSPPWHFFNSQCSPHC